MGIDGAWEIFNRSVTTAQEDDRTVLTMDEGAGEGIAWLNRVDFRNGVIEFEARGRDWFQRSFVGLAFRGIDSATFDVVYFRPFNFLAADSARRAHAVQYASHPAHGWARLRAEFPGVYEKAVRPAPDPNGWIRVRLVVKKPVVRVYVNGSAAPVLVIDELTQRTGGKIGLWVGESSGGSFANVVITRDN